MDKINILTTGEAIFISMHYCLKAISLGNVVVFNALTVASSQSNLTSVKNILLTGNKFLAQKSILGKGGNN